MAVLIEPQDDCFNRAWFKAVVRGAALKRGSELRLVARIADGARPRIGALVAPFIHHLESVKEPDGVAQFADQLVYGECLFGRPGGRYLDAEWTQMGRRRRLGWRGHAFLPRRLVARRSACSWASLRR